MVVLLKGADYNLYNDLIIKLKMIKIRVIYELFRSL